MSEPVQFPLRPQPFPVIEPKARDAKWSPLASVMFIVGVSCVLWSAFLVLLYPAMRLLDAAYGSFHHG